MRCTPRLWPMATVADPENRMGRPDGSVPGMDRFFTQRWPCERSGFVESCQGGECGSAALIVDSVRSSLGT